MTNKIYIKTSHNNLSHVIPNLFLTNDNENLRDTNMRLFLKVGEKVMNDKSDNSEQSGTSDSTPMPTIESLFDEKGELK